MNNKRKLTKSLYLLSGLLFFVASPITKNFVFIPIGCYFLIIGIKYWRGKPATNQKDKK